MVLYFKSTVTEPPAWIYMGRDKVENEELIRWGWPEDIWFHVDKLSSAHVYVRLPLGHTIEDMSDELVEDCAQLVKANSIMGNKQNDVDVVYTPWANLSKTGSMAVGQVGFHSDKAVKKTRVAKRRNEVVNRLEKTKVVEESVDLQGQREERDRKEREKDKAAQRLRKAAEEEERRAREEAKRLRSYDGVFAPAAMSSNKDQPDDDDDFM